MIKWLHNLGNLRDQSNLSDPSNFSDWRDLSHPSKLKNLIVPMIQIVYLNDLRSRGLIDVKKFEWSLWFEFSKLFEWSYLVI